MARFLAIHFPHKISGPMHRTLKHPRIIEVLTRVIGPNVKCMQSMLFIKRAGKPGTGLAPGRVLHPDPRPLARPRAWIALDDATVENGCLWVIPGSHRPGILWPLQPQDDPRFD